MGISTCPTRLQGARRCHLLPGPRPCKLPQGGGGEMALYRVRPSLTLPLGPPLVPWDSQGQLFPGCPPSMPGAPGCGRVPVISSSPIQRGSGGQADTARRLWACAFGFLGLVLCDTGLRMHHTHVLPTSEHVATRDGSGNQYQPLPCARPCVNSPHTSPRGGTPTRPADIGGD